MALDNSMFSFIFMGLSPYTILPYYAQHFTDSKVLIGLIPAIYIVGTTLPQPFLAKYVARIPRKKPYLLLTAFIQRIGIVALLLLSYLQPRMGLSDTTTLLILFISLAVQTSASGAYIPAWIDFVGYELPVRRGLMFGVSNFAGGVMGLGMGWLLTNLLETLPYSEAMPDIFGLAFLASVISYIAMLMWRETPRQAHENRLPQDKTSIFVILSDRNFVRYMAWRSGMVIMEIATPFYTLAALDNLQLGAEQVGIFTLILSLSQAFLQPLWGWFGDRRGFIRIVYLAAIFGAIAPVLALYASNVFIYYLVFVFVGGMMSGFQIANFNIVYDFSPATKIPYYIAVSQLALSPLSGIVPVLGGVIADSMSYQPNFIIAAITGGICCAGMAFSVRNPRTALRGQDNPEMQMEQG